MTIASVFTQIKNIKMIDPIFNGIRAAVVALILTAGLKLFTKGIFNIFIIVLTFIGIAYFELNPIIVIIMSVAFGILKNRKEEQ